MGDNPVSKLCQICLENEFKYTCPKCQTKTCSLGCVKTHKQQSDCDGRLDSTEFIKRTEFHENEALVQRDYNFLMGLNRTINVAKQETRTKNKKILMNANKRFQRGGVNEEYQSMTKRGVIVRNLPKGMQRASMNKSGWDKKAGTYMWTVEFILIDGETGAEVEKQTRFKVPEATLLKDSVHNSIREKLAEDAFFCFLKKVGSHNKVVPLDNDKLLADLLRDETVIEYPTIYISKSEEVKGFTVYEEESEESSEESSSEDSSSDDSESGTDDEPEEESSKQVTEATTNTPINEETKGDDTETGNEVIETKIA